MREYTERGKESMMQMHDVQSSSSSTSFHVTSTTSIPSSYHSVMSPSMIEPVAVPLMSSSSSLMMGSQKVVVDDTVRGGERETRENATVIVRVTKTSDSYGIRSTNSVEWYIPHIIIVLQGYAHCP